MEEINATYNGFPVRVVYVQRWREVVFYFNPDAIRVKERFDTGHKTFNNVTPQQWATLRDALLQQDDLSDDDDDDDGFRDPRAKYDALRSFDAQWTQDDLESYAIEQAA